MKAHQASSLVIALAAMGATSSSLAVETDALPLARTSSAFMLAQAEVDTLEQMIWNGVKDSDDPSLFEDYLNYYPDGYFREQAMAKLAALRAEAEGASEADAAASAPATDAEPAAASSTRPPSAIGTTIDSPTVLIETGTLSGAGEPSQASTSVQGSDEPLDDAALAAESDENGEEEVATTAPLESASPFTESGRAVEQTPQEVETPAPAVASGDVFDPFAEEETVADEGQPEAAPSGETQTAMVEQESEETAAVPTPFDPFSDTAAQQPAESEANMADLEELLSRAELALTERRLITPQDNSVNYWATQVLAIDGDNERAIELLRDAVDRYLLWGRSNIDRERFSAAQTYADRARMLQEYATPTQVQAIARLERQIRIARVESTQTTVQIETTPVEETPRPIVIPPTPVPPPSEPEPSAPASSFGFGFKSK